MWSSFFFFQAEDGIRYLTVTGVQTCALPIFPSRAPPEKCSCRRPCSRRNFRRRRSPLGCWPNWPRSSALCRREKIGRAACRERVEISVVAVSLKKKKEGKQGQSEAHQRTTYT